MRKKQPVMSHDPLNDIADNSVIEQPAEGAPEPAAQSAAKKPDGPLLLPSSLTIADVAPVHTELLDRMVSAEPFQLDASDVESVDGAGLQLLAVAHKAAAERGVSMQIVKPSEALLRAARQIGLESTLLSVGAA